MQGDGVTDNEDDDDSMRTNVSQDQVTATLYSEEVFLSVQYK
jgi:hypothetical protein